MSLFALLMTVALFAFSYINYQQTASSQPQMAGMKFMMVYLMPVMMLLWFNSYSSGLTSVSYTHLDVYKRQELRDLDLKKNYEQKLALCEQAEALVLEPSIVEAFHKLQKLHDEWREIGPVANEYKEVLWNRFKEASSRINKQHQEFFENIKQEQLRNLELKSELCVKAEELAQQPLTSRKEWNLSLIHI